MDEASKHPQEIIGKCDRLITRLESYRQITDDGENEYSNEKFIDPIVDLCRVRADIYQLKLNITKDQKNETKLKRLEKIRYKQAVNRLANLFLREFAPAYKKKNQYNNKFLKDEVNSIINYAQARFVAEIHEFAPDLINDFDPQKDPLKKALFVWIGNVLRLNYEILDKVDLRRSYPPKLRKYLKIIKFIHDRHGQIDLAEFVGKKKTQAEQEQEIKAVRAYLEEICRQSDVKIAGGDSYSRLIFDRDSYERIRDVKHEIIKAKIDSIINIDSIYSLDKSEKSSDSDGTQLVDKISSNKDLSLTEQLAEIRNQDSIFKNFKQAVRQALIQDTDKRLTGLCCRDNENWNCHYILLNTNPGTGIQATSLRKLVEGRGISYQTVYAHWKNICYTEICRITVEMANCKGMTEYIQADPRGLLRSCQFDEKTPAINCQNLASELISVGQEKITFVEEIKARRIRRDVAQKHNINPATPLHKFWNQKCLDLLAKIAFEVEDEYIWSQESIRNQRETLIETK